MTSKFHFDKHDKIVKEDKDMIDHSDRDAFNASQVNESQSETHKQKEQANTFVINFNNMEKLTYSQPTSLEIFGSKYTDITNWRSLYVRLLYDKFSFCRSRRQRKNENLYTAYITDR